MKAIIYSGSRNAFWKIVANDKIIAECSMPGLNPLFKDQKEILQQLNKYNVLINHAERIKKIYLFAAGASSPEKRTELADTLKLFFKYSKVEVKDDLYGAALAACFNQEGIVGILGSGSNCAYFDGRDLADNNYGLGYILGDEGSANHLGKILLKNYLEEQLPLDLRAEFEEKYNTDRAQILEKIYKKPEVQSYLTSFFDFLVENRTNTYVKGIINSSFDAYIKTYMAPTIQQYPNKEVHFVGTVAGTFPDHLRAVAAKHGIAITSITKEPVYNLINYYSTKT